MTAVDETERRTVGSRRRDRDSKGRKAMTNLQEIRDLVRKSARHDWHKIEEGPTYRSRFGFSTGPGDHWRLKEDSHHTTLVYMPDVDLTNAYGMDFDTRRRDDPEFEWSKVFPDKSVHICFADIFWRGSLVDRVDYALVDAARGTLPIGGGHDGLKITRWQRDVAELLHNLKGAHFASFDDFFGRVPFEVVTEE